jgi:hypothetical protein
VRPARAPIVADLGVWVDRAFLIAEYDPEADAIRVNARAVDAILAALGEREAERFVACAAEHERFHREHPRATEAEARAHANAVTGGDAERFARALAAARAG